MSQLETAMAILMRTFDMYAGAEGSKATLSKGEVKTMMEKELPSLLKVRPKSVLSQIQKNLNYFLACFHAELQYKCI